MKKLWCSVLMLAVCILLFTGCHGEQPPTDAVTPTEGLSDQPPVETVTPTDGQSEIIYMPPPAGTRDFALVYDEQCGYDLYFDTEGSFSYTVYILSRSPLDTAAIHLEPVGIPARECVILDLTPNMNYLSGNGGMTTDYPLYVYQTLMGLDWNEALNLQHAVSAAKAAKEADSGNQALQTALEEAQAQAAAYVNRYADEFAEKKQVLMDDHSYYVYEAATYFTQPAAHTQTVTEMTLTVGTQSHTLAIGQLRLHAALLDTLQLPAGGWQRIGDGMSGGSVQYVPWNTGEISLPMDFLVEEAAVLTGLALAEDWVTIDCIRIVRSTADGQVLEAQWDGLSDFPLDAGDMVELYVECSDPRLAGKAAFQAAWHPILYFTRNGESRYQYIGWHSNTLWSPYELCIGWLEGTDLSAYHRYQNLCPK